LAARTPGAFLQIIQRQKLLSAEQRTAITELIAESKRADLKFRLSTPGEQGLNALVLRALRRRKTVKGKIKALKTLVEHSPADSDFAVGLKVAIEILKDGDGIIYGTKPKAVAKDDDDSAKHVTDADAAGAVAGSQMAGGLAGPLGAIAMAAVYSTVALVSDAQKEQEEEDLIEEGEEVLNME
jgi:hypothetical protein